MSSISCGIYKGANVETWTSDPCLICLYSEVENEAYVLDEWAMASISGRTFKRKPRVAWKFSVREDTKIEIRPDFMTNERAATEFDDPDWEPFMPPDSNWQVTSNYEFRRIGPVQFGDRKFIMSARGLLIGNMGGLALDLSRIGGQHPEVVNDSVASIRKLLTNPEKLASLESTHCCWCGRPLRILESVKRGYGPECAKRYGLLWTTARDTAPAEPQEQSRSSTASAAQRSER